uniref:Helicase ATP-binding domain-containing protein n=1 Tax=Ditylenchus dipsaci TaxID=166011 RepID=A0A915CP41_9BILA
MSIYGASIRTAACGAYSGSGLLNADDVNKEFRAFLSKYQQKLLNSNGSKKEVHLPTIEEVCNTEGVPVGPYNKFHSADVHLGQLVTNKFALRDVPQTAVEQFDYAISLYLKFRNARKFKKLKALKDCQASLPIAKERERILDAVSKNQVIIIAGDTGCGKSTQLPQYLLNAGFTKICCTQPRRIACTALARRVACETLNQFNTEIAFQTRFDKTKTSNTRMLFLTEGVLLRQMASDPDLAL